MSDVLSNLSLGFSVALSLQNLAFCFLGCVVGTLVGVLPGLGPVATVAKWDASFMAFLKSVRVGP